MPSEAEPWVSPTASVKAITSYFGGGAAASGGAGGWPPGAGAAWETFSRRLERLQLEPARARTHTESQ